MSTNTAERTAILLNVEAMVRRADAIDERIARASRLRWLLRLRLGRKRDRLLVEAEKLMRKHDGLGA